MKLRKLYGSHKITIPKPIVELLQWADGDEIGFSLKDGNLVLKKVVIKEDEE